MRTRKAIEVAIAMATMKARPRRAMSVVEAASIGSEVKAVPAKIRSRLATSTVESEGVGG